ncbi:enoyl-CoA hydratase/isomerase family protein [Aestuariirhabdus litorea]|uniref:Enoyl-CoA hydratase/isomerase family protein n=1 Tax=Aestuariirhabdus litorea TaxID=2528527 RepID=A0A3P3VI51_9GAMM|nr:enoyl-CoA hydratase-related protein [Aestuariirhabdus litorea]RRJ82411.1 enoyl-CoA hydratase/isomerase family protein [Aestuariirhabdus litorea]RWW92574.1 enoyl-CoA hydratase/isomerase family protein [Endozoicomonadaceae bacterium GTF-13]
MQKVIVEKKDGVVHVRLNRPEVMNACDGDTYNAIADAWDELENDPSLRVGILSGEGRAFCVGTDIKWVKSPAAEGFQDRLYPRMLSLTKPVVAAIHGHCNGGGLEQALGADIRVSSDDAHYGFGEARLGWIPGGHGTQRLPRLIPLGNALELLYTANRIDAREAHRLGLVNHVVPADQLISRCEQIAEDIIKSAPLAVQKMKVAVMQGLDMPMAQGVRLEQECFKWLMQTEDAKEGALAFAEKRAPNWQAK